MEAFFMSKTELLNKLEQQKDKALTSNKGVVTSIAKLQDAQNAKPIKRRHRKKKKEKHISPLKIGRNASTSSQTNTLSLKIYTEQLMQADIRAKYEELAKELKQMQDADDCDEAEYKAKQDEFDTLDREACTAFIERVKAIDPKQFCVVSIKHDKDEVRNNDDLFEISIKKPHWHIYVWTPSDSVFYDAGRSFRVHTMICGDSRKGHEKQYLGINYDPKRDVSIWDNRGAERIHSIIASVAYCLHISSSAIEAGKHVYDKSEIITNLSNGEIDEMLNLYKGIDNHFIRKPNADDWNTWAQTAYERGLHLENFEDWAVDHFMVNQMASAKFRVVRDFYNRGLRDGLANAPHIDRLNVFILGRGNLGKSYNSQKALLDMGIERIVNAPSGTGKYDGVTADTQAILFDDSRMTQPKRVMEQKPVTLHRRNNGDPVWKGQYVIYTSNFASPIDAAADCLGYQPYKDTDGTFKYTDKQMLDIDPVIERAFFCTVELDTDPSSANYGHFHLVLCQGVDRGGANDIERLTKMFEQFRKAFDKSIYNYEAKPVLEFQAKIRTEKEIKQRLANNENVAIPSSIGGYDYDAIEADRLPLNLDFKLRADLKGQVDAWNEYADKLNHQYSKNVPNEWADIITRLQNEKMSELNKYSSEPMCLDDPLGDNSEPVDDDFTDEFYEYFK